MQPWNMSQNQLAELMGVNVSRVNEIIRQRRDVTGDTALRLARVTGMSPEFWLGLQSQYEIDVTADALGERLEREVREYSEAA